MYRRPPAAFTLPPPVPTSCLPTVPHGDQVTVVGAGHRTYSEFTVLHGFTYVPVCTVALYYFATAILRTGVALHPHQYLILYCQITVFFRFFSQPVWQVQSRISPQFYIFGHTLGHAASQLPDQGSNPCPLQGKHGFLITRPPGKSLVLLILYCHTNHTIYIICSFCLASQCNSLRFMFDFVYISSLFFFISKNTALYEYTTNCLASHLTMDTQGVSNL